MFSRSCYVPGWVREGINGSAEPFGKLKALSLSKGSPKSPTPILAPCFWLLHTKPYARVGHPEA